jgi:hypothetical protein
MGNWNSSLGSLYVSASDARTKNNLMLKSRAVLARWARWNQSRAPTQRVRGEVRQRPSAGLADPVPCTPSSMPLAPCLSPLAFAILRGMSIRQGGGDWEPMLLGIEPRNCKVCKEGLYRNKTFFSGGWSRCSLCEEFVHYSCLATGKVSFLKVRPRVCKTCRAAQEGTPSPSPKAATPVAVGS